MVYQSADQSASGVQTVHGVFATPKLWHFFERPFPQIDLAFTNVTDLLSESRMVWEIRFPVGNSKELPEDRMLGGRLRKFGYRFYQTPGERKSHIDRLRLNYLSSESTH